jgi:cytochrome c biogenesis protein CcmG/thiol:disulfide interchange protein DsbE
VQRRRVLLLALVPIVALFALLAWALVRSGGQPAGVSINSVFGEVALKPSPAKDFTLPLLTGQSLTLSSLKGKVVMVDFWSSWCPPCRQEAPALAAAYERYRARGVEFVGVAIWDSEDEVRKFLERNRITYPNGLDLKGVTAIEYGVRGIPEKFFVDRDGTLVRKFIGPVTEQRLAAVLDEMLAR